MVSATTRNNNNSNSNSNDDDDDDADDKNNLHAKIAIGTRPVTFSSINSINIQNYLKSAINSQYEKS